MIGGPGRVGSVGAAARRGPVLPVGSADFTLSNTTVATSWGIETVGSFNPINAPPGVTFRIVETAGASGDEAGFAVVTG